MLRPRSAVAITEGGLAIDRVPPWSGPLVAACLLALAALAAFVPVSAARAQPGVSLDAQLRQSTLVAEGLGQLALALRAYAQLGLQVEPEQAREHLVQVRAALDAQLAQIVRRAGRQLPEAEARRLRQRWRSVRDATYTRPSTEIVALMSDIGEDITAQLRGLAPLLPPDPPPQAQASWLQQQLDRAWQRQNLQQLAREGLFGCWRSDLIQWPRLAETRADFGRWLSAQEGRLPPVHWVQYNAQWNLLVTSLPREGAGCTPQGMQSLVGTTERLVKMIAALP